MKRSYMVTRDRDQPSPLLSSVFSNRHMKKLLCRLTIWNPKDKLQSIFGEGPNTGWNTLTSYWISCFISSVLAWETTASSIPSAV